jgi:hypothetical protein
LPIIKFNAILVSKGGNVMVLISERELVIADLLAV